MSKTDLILKRIYDADIPDSKDLEYLLSLKNDAALCKLFCFADEVRAEFAGPGVLLRGIVEFSSFCRNACLYCGLNRNNRNLQRYRLTSKEILGSIARLSAAGIKTVVLQSGEDDALDYLWFAGIIQEIKAKFSIAITLCLGERTLREYKVWRRAGADRYLLKIETSDRKLYESLHPGMSFPNRLRCLRQLRELGYQVGSGNIIGLKGQSLKHIAGDIIFFKQNNFDMIGIGPFIPHQRTKLSSQSRGDTRLTLKTLALTRIVTKYPHLPATTALGSQEEDYRVDGLKIGANVLMPNFTPLKYKALYEIYPGKRCISEESRTCLGCLKKKVNSIGRELDYSRGDSLFSDLA